MLYLSHFSDTNLVTLLDGHIHSVKLSSDYRRYVTHAQDISLSVMKEMYKRRIPYPREMEKTTLRELYMCATHVDETGAREIYETLLDEDGASSRKFLNSNWVREYLEARGVHVEQNVAA